MWDSLLDFLGQVLAFFYGIVPSYGVAIIGLTILVRLALYPLTAKSARSMLEMQRVQPEIKRLQEQLKGDRQKLNEATAALFKEHKINPLGGCLPIVMQAPVFMALFSLLRKAYTHVPVNSDLYRAVCDAAEVSKCKPNPLNSFGMDLTVAAKADHAGSAFPYFALVALVVVTGILQYRQTQARQTQAAANPQMQMMGRIMPIMFGFISLSLPAGVVVYMFVSNLWQIGQQAVVYRHGHVPIFGGDEEDSSETASPGSAKPGSAKPGSIGPGQGALVEEVPSEPPVQALSQGSSDGQVETPRKGGTQPAKKHPKKKSKGKRRR